MGKSRKKKILLLKSWYQVWSDDYLPYAYSEALNRFIEQKEVTDLKEGKVHC